MISNTYKLAWIIAGLIAVHLFFYFIQWNQAKTATGAIRALAKKQELASEPYILSQALSDLENLKIIQCTKISAGNRLSPMEIDHSYKPGCDSGSPWLHSYFPIEDTAVAANGIAWKIESRSVNSSTFYIALWLSRALAVSLVLLLLRIHRLKIESAVSLHNLELSHLRQARETAREVAHDIMSPLAILSTLSKLKRAEGPEGELEQEALGRLKNLSENLLGKTSLDESAIGQWLPEFARAKEMELQERRTSIVLEIDEDLRGAKLSGNTYQWKRTLSNLINNAVESYEAGPVEVFVAARRDGEKIAIEVRDKGRGIDEARILQINEGRITSSKATGLGIGLSSTIKHVKSLGGSVEMLSRVGQGTTVKISLANQQV